MKRLRGCLFHKMITAIVIFTTLISFGAQQVRANNHFIFPFEINQAINGLNMKLKNVNLNELGVHELRSVWHRFTLERILKLDLKSIETTSGRIYQRTRFNISQECRAEIYKVAKGIVAQEMWAFRVLDSLGKPPSGILEGAIDWPGEYAECMNSTNPAVNWTAKYCSISSDDKSLAQGPNNPRLFFTYGLCSPVVCSRDDIASALNIVIDEFHLNNSGILPKNFSFNSNNVVCQDPKYLDTPAKVALSIIFTIMVIILLFTIVDIYRLYIHNSIFKTEIQNVLIQINDDTVNPSEIEHLLHANLEENPLPNEPRIFNLIPSLSIVRSTKRIFNLNVEKNQLNCLHSIRFLTMSWIILAHSFGFILFFTDNIAVVPDYIRSFSLTFVTNGFLSVDTFFLLSGILGSFMFLKERSKPNVTFSFKFFFKYYFHRFIRISPPYFIVLMISILLSKYFGAGPLFPPEGYEPAQCRQTWWRNILYINNFFKPEEMCLSVSWYLSNDMQFHWMAPLMLIPFALGKFFIGVIVSFLFIVGSIVATILILYLNPESELGIFGNNANVFSELVYFKPWSRIGPFVVGIILGYILFVKKTQMRPKINIAVNNTLWMGAILLCSVCVFGLYPDFKDFPNTYFSRWPHIFYQGLSRVLWAIGLSYMIYACETSNGGIVNRVLTWKLWLPLSRLTYSAYLIHLTVIFYFNTTQQHLFHWQNTTLIYYFIANLFFSYAAAFFVCVFFELPLISLEKFIIKRN